MMLPDTISLIKKDGTRIDDISADVQSKIVFIDDHNLPLEEGDILQRTLPNGLEENYKVLDRGYISTNGGGEYQAKVKKLTSLSNNPEVTVYNLHGDNSRININSDDSSVNIVNKNSEEFFGDLRTAVTENISGADKKELLKRIDELEDSKGTVIFPKKYAEFMAIAANHTTVLAPYFPALIQFLAQ